MLRSSPRVRYVPLNSTNYETELPKKARRCESVDGFLMLPVALARWTHSGHRQPGREHGSHWHRNSGDASRFSVYPFLRLPRHIVSPSPSGPCSTTSTTSTGRGHGYRPPPSSRRRSHMAAQRARRRDSPPSCSSRARRFVSGRRTHARVQAASSPRTPGELSLYPIYLVCTV